MKDAEPRPLGNETSAATGAAAQSPPSTGGSSYAVYILSLLIIANALSLADRSLFSVVLPAIKADFGASDSVLGLIAGPGFIISYIVLTMPLARLADRWSRRRVLAIAVATFSLATAACGAAASLVQLTIARVLVGVGEAGGMPPSQALIAGLFNKRRSTAMGALASSTYFGVLLGLAGGAAIAGTWGWRAAFLALAVPGIPVALLIWLTGPRRQATVQPTTPRPTVSTFAAIALILRIRPLLLLALGMGVFNIYGYAGSVWLPAYFMRSHGLSVLEAGAWLGVGAAAGGIVGSFASGAIVDALVPRDSRWQLRVPALGFMLAFPVVVLNLLMPGGAALHVMGHSVPLVALLAIISAFLGSLWMGPSYSAVARLVPPEMRSQAVALLVIVGSLVGSAIGPVVAGWVSDLLVARMGAESLRYSLLSMSVLILLGGIIFWRASIHYPGALAEQRA